MTLLCNGPPPSLEQTWMRYLMSCWSYLPDHPRPSLVPGIHHAGLNANSRGMMKKKKKKKRPKERASASMETEEHTEFGFQVQIRSPSLQVPEWPMSMQTRCCPVMSMARPHPTPRASAGGATAELSHWLSPREALAGLGQGSHGCANCQQAPGTRHPSRVLPPLL